MPWSRPNSCSWCQDYMKSPPRHKLNPIRGLLGTRDDFPPATANRETARPRGRPLITLMYATLTPASSAKDRMPPAERQGGGRDFVHMLTSTNPASRARGTPPSHPDSSLSDGQPKRREGGREKKKKSRPSPTREQFITMPRKEECLLVLAAFPASAAVTSRRQRVTGGERDCRQEANTRRPKCCSRRKNECGSDS